MIEALEFAHGIIRKLIALQKELYAQIQPVKREVSSRLWMPAEMRTHRKGILRQDLRGAAHPGQTHQLRPAG